MKHIYEDFTKQRNAENELGEILADNLNASSMRNEVMDIISRSLEQMLEKTQEVFVCTIQQSVI